MEFLEKLQVYSDSKPSYPFDGLTLDEIKIEINKYQAKYPGHHNIVFAFNWKSFANGTHNFWWELRGEPTQKIKTINLP